MSTSKPKAATGPPQRPPRSHNTGGRSFRGLSPNERQQRRRQQLLEAGLALFGTQGFHATGVREICAEAKLTERYFYESFQNREALFQAVFEQAVERQRRAVIAAVDPQTREVQPQDATGLARAALRNLLENYRKDPRLARILLIEVFGAGSREASLAASQSFAELIAGAVTPFLSKDARERYDVQHIADGLYGSTVRIAMRWAEEGFAEPLDKVLDHCLIFYEALLRRLSEPARSRTTPHGASRRSTQKRSTARQPKRKTKRGEDPCR